MPFFLRQHVEIGIQSWMYGTWQTPCKKGVNKPLDGTPVVGSHHCTGETSLGSAGISLSRTDKNHPAQLKRWVKQIPHSKGPKTPGRSPWIQKYLDLDILYGICSLLEQAFDNWSAPCSGFLLFWKCSESMFTESNFFGSRLAAMRGRRRCLWRSDPIRKNKLVDSFGSSTEASY